MAGEGELRRESDRIGAPRGDGMAPNGERRRRRRRNEEENKKGIFFVCFELKIVWTLNDPLIR